MKINNILVLAITVITFISLTGFASAAVNLPADPNSNSKSKGDVTFFTDQTTYKYGEDITFTLLNGGDRTILVPNIFKSKWKIVNLKTHEKILIPLEDCGYGNCGDPFTKLGDRQKIKQTWDQFNNDDEHVPAGTYQASATYTFTNKDSKSPNKDSKSQTIVTKNFNIKAKPKPKH